MPTLPTDADGKLEPFDAAAITAMNIKRYGVRDHTHVETDLGPDGAGCTRRFHVAWDERYNAAIYFAGAVTSYIHPVSGLRKLSRLIPQRDPDFDNWICTKCRIMPWRFTGNIETPAAGSEPLPQFERAELVVTYEMVPFDLVDDDDTVVETQRYVTWPGFPGTEVQTETDYIGLPGGIAQFVTDDGSTRPAGVPIPYPVGFPESKSVFRMIWRRVAFDVWQPTTALFQRLIGTQTTRGYLGAVNLTTFRGYPPLQLQLRGIEQRLLPDPTGLGYSWDLSYLLSNKPVPYGQLGFYHHDLPSATPPLSDGSASGYYMVMRPAAGEKTKPPASLGDNDSLFHVREFANLFNPGV